MALVAVSFIRISSSLFKRHPRYAKNVHPSLSAFLTALILTPHALPALPVCMISPVGRSSLLSTGQPVPSAFANVNSSFVPMILNSDVFVSIGAYSGIEVANRLLSEVNRSRSKVVGEEKMTLDFAFSIFLR